MNWLAVLVVTVVGVGGPHGVAPSRLANATVTVSQGGKVIASARSGRLRLRVHPGVYRVSARLVPPGVRRVQQCESRSVRVTRGTRSVTLGCSIK
jgi:hypothetical protein